MRLRYSRFSVPFPKSLSESQKLSRAAFAEIPTTYFFLLIDKTTFYRYDAQLVSFERIFALFAVKNGLLL